MALRCGAWLVVVSKLEVGGAKQSPFGLDAKYSETDLGRMGFAAAEREV